MADQLTINAFLIIAVFYIIMMAVSIPANLLIIIATITDKKLRSPTNMLVCNLSVASLIIATLRIPVKLYELLNPDASFLFPNSTAMCQFQQILPASCVLCISITLTTICVDRFMAIMYPMKQHLKMTLIRLYIFLPCSWIVAFACFIAYASYATLFPYKGNIYCVPVYPKGQNDIIIHETTANETYPRTIEATKIAIWSLFIPFAFLIPSIIMSTLYIRLVLHLWSGKGPSDETHTIALRDQIKRLKQKRRVIKILIACCTVFIATNLPYYIIIMLLDMGFITVANTSIVVNTLIMVNLSAIAYNPIIYGYFNKSFRYRVDAMIRNMVGLTPRRRRTFTVSSNTATSQAPNNSQRYSPRQPGKTNPKETYLKTTPREPAKSCIRENTKPKVTESVKNTERASIETTLTESVYSYSIESFRHSKYSSDV
ncbi:Tachykinin-like peptides receptor 86C [Trichoplax sp. H2]|uniref:G-protein coupled receptors family 1 profile domain-containing protein n=1 Tax=Trichoplax adhaerens TaxID=10228 RepID=B3S4W4_TRIAD|nr:hypothetical protein TRIADDRAFT_59369 [Trichoplax adhaerens]EDV22161.1 hypothetical protein TRIADDRAFT_59369 [Trichoplax adhaerens]RDD37926.1 Tachykinin-like peptides receptor 86C [Trichoplax sp. H2]|eukprot:XP_002115316.1 hypothetical protein TRIADDRAFT_59369 [Trichoplax adhaerens]